MTMTTTRLARAIGSSRLALTVECLPPRSVASDDAKRLASHFPSCVDAVVVADNHEAVRSSALVCAALLVGEKTETLLSMVTRDKNRIALESDVLGAAALGVQGVLCLSGLHQSLGASAKALGTYDLDSCQLARGLTRMADEGVGFAGDKLEHPPSLFVAATAHPYMKPIELSLLGIRKKIRAGAQALFTDAITDLGAFDTWMTAVCAEGYDKQVAIIASIRPDALNLAVQLKRIEGVRGIHILSGGHESEVARFIQQGGLA